MTDNEVRASQTQETMKEISPTGGSGLPRWIGLVVLPGIIFVMLLWMRANVSKDAGVTTLPVIGPAPAFSLIERGGATVTRDDLRGRVWVADFVFTRCAGPCPELTLRMRSLQQALQDRKDDVRLVSFTLDPEYDTPSVLQEYAKKNRADERQWLFLTGADQKTIHDMIRNGFLQSVIAAKDGEPIVHSTYFVLVDRQGQIRGFYDGLDPTTKKKILGDMDWLLRQRVGE